MAPNIQSLSEISFSSWICKEGTEEIYFTISLSLELGFSYLDAYQKNFAAQSSSRPIKSQFWRQVPGTGIL